jgi:hypothetical protein
MTPDLNPIDGSVYLTFKMATETCAGKLGLLHTVMWSQKAGIVESDRKLISYTTASIANQRLDKQLSPLQRMLRKVFP